MHVMICKETKWSTYESKVGSSSLPVTAIHFPKPGLEQNAAPWRKMLKTPEQEELLHEGRQLMLPLECLQSVNIFRRPWKKKT